MRIFWGISAAHGLVQDETDGGHDQERDRQKHQDEPGGLAAHLRSGLRNAEDVDENAGKGFQKAHIAEDKLLAGCAGNCRGRLHPGWLRGI